MVRLGGSLVWEANDRGTQEKDCPAFVEKSSAFCVSGAENFNFS